jgi:hypothetical protein
MTDRDLGALLERASEHLPEVDFANGAWSAAVAERARRRRLALGTVGALAAAGLAVTAVQLGGSTKPRPAPAVSTTTSASVGTLADGTAYALMPLEGKESQLPDFDAGLPSTVDVNARTVKLSSITKPLGSVVAVYLRADGAGYRPVLVQGGGKQFVADHLLLAPTHDSGGNAAAPLGPRAVGGGGRYAVFPQPGKVVRLDTHTGAVTTYAVPSQDLESAGWTSTDDLVVARSEGQTWTIDPWTPGSRARPAGPAAYEGLFRVSSDEKVPGKVVVTRQRSDRQPGTGETFTAPVFDLWGETLSTQEWAATGAYFDQNLTSAVIRRGNGPIYQGLVAVEADRGKARVLLAPENPDGQTGRFKGCCAVLGWADGKTVLFQSVGSHGRWILAWDVTNGQVFDVTHLVTGAPDDPVTPIALNVGWRY